MPEVSLRQGPPGAGSAGGWLSELADIEFAARQASQRALEDAFFDQAGSATTSTGPTTQDYLSSIEETRTTVTQPILEEFTQDIDSTARV